MKKIISIVIFLFAGIFLSAQTNASETKTDSIKNDSTGEVMPRFPGPEHAFEMYLTNSIRYPQMEKEMNKQGTVYVTFTVEKDGSITDVKMAKEIPGAPGFSKEAIRVISEMPNWIPGKLDGKVVRVTVTQPVRFILEGGKKKKKKKH